MGRDKRGQNGSAISRTFEQFNDKEQAIIGTLHKAGVPLSNREIREANGWTDDKGSSRVRNGLRRPCRAGWVEHAATVGDGRYLLTTHALQQLGEEVRPKASPTPFYGEQDENGCYDVVDIKRPDCEMYNSCLDHAIAENWPNFGCHQCKIYQILDNEQRAQDVLGLIAAHMAAKNVEKMGKAGRTRGVKPGADAKVKRKNTVMF